MMMTNAHYLLMRKLRSLLDPIITDNVHINSDLKAQESQNQFALCDVLKLRKVAGEKDIAFAEK